MRSGGMGSLARQFEAPKGYQGVFGWMCGYSADRYFLDMAAERFTGMIKEQRAQSGNLSLAIVLDPGNPPISLVEVPGVAHLPLKKAGSKPFKLMHAKVALLGYASTSGDGGWLLRLIVSTGNWTLQTLEESLDLVWRVDLYSQDIESGNRPAEASQAASDVVAAWDMLQWLAQSYDTALMRASRRTLTRLAQDNFIAWIEAVENLAAREEVKPRFMDNREASFFQSLPGMVDGLGEGIVARNYLAMGSGFFQDVDHSGNVPSVINSIWEMLHKQGLLTANPELDIFVNPKACQGIAESVDVLNSDGYTIRPARDPLATEQVRRSLHAKFLFGATERSNSKWCLHPWVYLGSGNLTERGFMLKASPEGGNLEAGVVFTPGDIVWEAEKNAAEEPVVTDLLPIHWDEEATTSSLESGQNEEDGEPGGKDDYVAPPVPWLVWREGPGGNLLEPPSGVDRIDFEVLDESGGNCPHGEHSGFVWLGECRPRLVRLCWEDEKDVPIKGDVPVLDEFGRLAAGRLPRWEVEEAWGQLAGFPLPPPVDDPDDPADPDDPDDDSEHGTPGSAGTGIGVPPSRYPLHAAMEFVENIAAKQTALAEADWQAWCLRLEQCLAQAAESKVAKTFKELGLNLFSPLWREEFRPSYAEDNATEYGKLYEETLDRVEVKWAVKGLQGFGGAS